MNAMIRRSMVCQTRRIAVLVGLIGTLGLGSKVYAQETILDFSDVPSGTLTVSSPYTSQGFTLTSTSGGFVFNSPDTGNGASQTPGNNSFYAGANGLAAFVPATITLTRTNGNPFSLHSIDLARNFAFDPAPTTTFTGTQVGGSTVSATFTVTSPSPPLTFQTFNFTGFVNLTSVSWDQGVTSQEGVHQFSNIHLATPVPGPDAFAVLSSALVVGGLFLRPRRRT